MHPDCLGDCLYMVLCSAYDAGYSQLRRTGRVLGPDVAEAPLSVTHRQFMGPFYTNCDGGQLRL